MARSRSANLMPPYGQHHVPLSDYRSVGTWSDDPSMTDTDPLAAIRSRFAAKWEPRVRVGEGWAPLLVELDAAITEVSPETRYIHIKEKAAKLVVLVTPPANTEVKSLIDAAQQRAQSTCENCGSPGVPCEKFGWTHILCPRCAARDGYSPR